MFSSGFIRMLEFELEIDDWFEKFLYGTEIEVSEPVFQNDDDDAMGHGVCQIMMFVGGGGWGSGKTQNKITSFMNSAL